LRWGVIRPTSTRSRPWQSPDRKVVFSRTLKTVDWANTTIAGGDTAEEIDKLMRGDDPSGWRRPSGQESVGPIRGSLLRAVRSGLPWPGDQGFDLELAQGLRLLVERTKLRGGPEGNPYA